MKFDVAVIGCGSVGLTVAAALNQAGLKVLGVEPRDEIRDKVRAGIAPFREPRLTEGGDAGTDFVADFVARLDAEHLQSSLVQSGGDGESDKTTANDGDIELHARRQRCPVSSTNSDGLVWNVSLSICRMRLHQRSTCGRRSRSRILSAGFSGSNHTALPLRWRSSPWKYRPP